jgi:dephospho-CoA kinase
MLVIGLAGGIASGKSLVASQFQSLGAVALDADQIGHDVLREPEIKRRVKEEWGEWVFERGEINRRALAEIVFQEGPDAALHLATLERITHPRIGEILSQRLKHLEADSQPLAVILDAPVMFKAGWDQMCDKIVFVDAPLQLRIRRARARGWTELHFFQRESHQPPNDLKRANCSDIIDNSGSVEATFAQVKRLWVNWGLPLPKQTLRADHFE